MIANVGMAAPGGKFFIQDKLQDVAPHHASFQVRTTHCRGAAIDPLLNVPSNYGRLNGRYQYVVQGLEGRAIVMCGQ